MSQKIHTFLDDMKERSLSENADDIHTERSISADDLTPEEEFLSQLLSGRDLSSLRDPQHEQEIYDEALSLLTEEQLKSLHERESLQTVFDDIRQRSHEAELTTCDYWAAVGLVPNHLDDQSFTRLVLKTINNKHVEPIIEESLITSHEQLSESEEDNFSASSTSDNLGTKTEDFNSESETNDTITFSSPEVEAKYEELISQPIWDIDDIQILEGSEIYLYSQREMTDNFAHWAFLAAEDNDVLTLVDNARVESKIYPRPMKLKSLTNKPYYLSAERIWNAFHEAQESGDYPDIQTCSASNGETYFYSTLYLSTPQAKALAEWISVEKKANM